VGNRGDCRFQRYMVRRYRRVFRMVHEMMITVERAAWGFEARIRGKAGDDIAAAIAPTRMMALEALRHAVEGLPSCKNRNDAIALLNNY